MPEEPITPVGKLRPVSPNQSKPVGELKPVGVGTIPHLQNYAPDLSGQNQLENTLNDIVKTSRRTISDSEKDILRDVLSNPNRTPEQVTEAIQTLQGYHPKFQNEQQKEGNRTYYYLKREDNGVLVPKALTYGERPPAGYDVASVWGNPKQANDDSWYTDLGKSLYNGVVGAVQSVAELGQLGTIAATGEESDFLNSTINTAEQLKFTKDESLKTPIYNTEGINKWADLLDLDRFNFSKESLWGTINMAAESVTEFMVGAKGVSGLIKGAGGVGTVKNAVTGAVELNKAGINASAFTASFLQNLGENIELAKENGLEGREIAAFALPVTAGQAAIDAKWGLQSTIYKNLFTKTEKQLLKDFAKQTLKTSTGELSEAGLKELIKGTVLAYDSKLAILGKDVLASMTKEGLQEAGQDVVEKAGEELFDKLGGEEKFGTNATDPKSFGSYMQNLVTGFVTGAPLSFVAGQQRKSNERQSIDAFKIVEGGQDKMNEFKANVYAAQRNGDLTEQQRDQAIFKIDTYNKYWNQTKDLNMSKEERRKAFELAFSIEGLKNEIPANTEDLDPIDIAKVKNKEELIKGLQKDLNGLLLKQEIIKEPVVGQDTIDKVDKATKPKEGEEEPVATLDDLLKRFGALEAEETDELDLTEKSEKRKAVPKFTDVDEKGNYKFAQLSDPLQQKQSLHDYFKENPQLNNQMDAFIVQGQNNVWKLDLGNGRYIQFARSIEPEQYVGNTEKFPSGTESFTDSDGREYTRYTTPVGMRLETIKSKSTPQGYKRVLNIYNKETGEHIAFAKETKKGTSKYTEDELTQLQDIQKKDNRSPYQRPPERESVSKEEIKAFADKMQQGTLEQTPENSQFYENNKKAIESELRKRVKSNIMNPVDQETEQRYFEQNRPLSDTEVQEQLESEQGREQVFSETGQFQKQTTPGDFNTILDRIREVMPKVNVELDNTIKGAGQVQGNTLKINPDYAGRSTPIHEAGHILIDAIGYNNPVIKSAIKQLKSTDLWKQTQDLYPELNEEMLGKEVLAEAIGREGEGIFDTEVKKNAFLRLLDYIYGRLKQLLGVDKNIAKSLAKQIIGGIGTSELTGQNEQVQEQKSDYTKNAEKLYNKIRKEDDLTKYSYEDLVDAYNYIITSDLPKGKVLDNLMVRIAMNIFDRQVKKLESDPEFSVEKARTMDATAKDIKFKVLSHFTDSFPELQALSDMWDKAYFNKVKESREEKRTNEKLATEVIKDFNSKLPIEKRITNFIQSLYSNINYKYFDFLDDGTGKVITMDQAKKKGLSAPQMNYLKFIREKLSEREKLIGDEDIYNIDMEVLRLDKKFWEATRTENLSQAFSNWLATTPRLNDVKIGFTDPETNATSVMSFKDVESRLVNYGNKGLKQKIKSLGLLLKYNFSARKKLKEGPNKLRGEYLLDENGKLQSKFNKVTDSSKSYSKDFYNAMNEFIEDNNHIKHISPLMPVINSIEYLNTKGAYSNTGEELHAAKPNVVKWINEWRDLHILRKEKETIPELDMSLKFLRFLTSATSMWFAVPANILNDVIGVYNNWRQFGGKAVAKGNLRLFTGGDRKFKKEYGYGLVNRYAVDILRKYGAVSTDVDSNPGRTVKNVVLEMAYLLQKYGEFHIQGSGLLGLMDKKDFDSFEYRKNPDTGIEELVVKQGVNEAELEARILKLINEVSDVQGKYSDKDKRNIMNNELGKAVMQFKTWMPDWWRIRFGDKGSYVNSVKWVMDGMREDMREKGVVKAFWDNKDFMRTMRGIMGVGFMMSIAYQDDDDKKKSEASKLFQRALSDVLFVFDPDNLKFTLTRPIAAIGTIEKLINATDHLFALEADDYYKRTGDPKILNDLLTLTPGRKIADTIDMLDGEEN